MRRLASIILGALLACTISSTVAIGHTAPLHHPIRVRWCPEDAVHVGVGDFDGVRWDRYKCIARDDLGGI